MELPVSTPPSTNSPPPPDTNPAPPAFLPATFSLSDQQAVIQAMLLGDAATVLTIATRYAKQALTAYGQTHGVRL